MQHFWNINPVESSVTSQEAKLENILLLVNRLTDNC